MRTRTRLHWHEEVDISFKTLDEAKTFWVTKQSFFEARGYVLDPITHSQDTANLRDYSHTSVPICSIGDSADNQDVSIWTFATRVSDNRHVCIKCVGTLSWELLLLKLLHEGANQFDASNHCVPVLEVIRDDERQEISYLVMPALRALGPMSFKTVNDVLEFTSQVLLGLNFMHRKDVGHRDCSMHKIMIDPFEPHTSERQPSLLRRWYKSMKQVATLRSPKQNDLCSTKYYFVGFGGVIDCADEGKQCASGNYSKDQEPPEFAGPLRLYNPLLLDIFLVGNMLLHDFLDKYSNVDFLEKLIPRMVKCTPGDRENAKAVLRIWLTILPQISSSERSKRLRIRTKPRAERKIRIR